MVPEVGVEPTWALSPLDFESSAYTNFATPARINKDSITENKRQPFELHENLEYLIREKHPFSSQSDISIGIE